MISDVAALYVDRNGPYPSRVQHWYDDRRDARTYSAELPVVAHPPCHRWCRLAGLVEARGGHKRGDDGGLFAHALSEVRRVGGVLEHPAYARPSERCIALLKLLVRAPGLPQGFRLCGLSAHWATARFHSNPRSGWTYLTPAQAACFLFAGPGSHC